MKIVHQQSDSAPAFITGAIVGIAKYLINVDASFGEKLFESLITAFLCGVAGWAGKELIVAVKKKLTKRKVK